jgi:ketosteroid isomerase-like protein
MTVYRRSFYCVALVAVVGLLMSLPAWAGGIEDYASMAKAWEAAYNTGDAAAVAGFYTEDGMRLPPNMAMVKGREAIQGQVQQGMDRGGVKVTIDMVEYEVKEDLGFGRGTYAIMDAEGKTIDQGKWVEIGRLVAGKWYTYCDIWNSDMPLPQAPSVEE